MKKGFLIKSLIDTVMTGLMLLSMAYQVTGGDAHEIAGVSLLSFMVVHNILNATWYTFLIKGNRGFCRIIWIATNISLLMMIAVTMISGIMLSRTVFSFLKIRETSFARQIHTVAAYWCFICMSVHVGLHWHTILKSMRISRRVQSSRARRIPAYAASLLLIIWGIKSSFDRNIGKKLLMYASFDYLDPSSSRMLYILSYFSIMAMYICITYYAMKIITRITTSAH